MFCLLHSQQAPAMPRPSARRPIPASSRLVGCTGGSSSHCGDRSQEPSSAYFPSSSPPPRQPIGMDQFMKQLRPPNISPSKSYPRRGQGGDAEDGEVVEIQPWEASLARSLQEGRDIARRVITDQRDQRKGHKARKGIPLVISHFVIPLCIRSSKCLLA